MSSGSVSSAIDRLLAEAQAQAQAVPQSGVGAKSSTDSAQQELPAKEEPVKAPLNAVDSQSREPEPAPDKKEVEMSVEVTPEVAAMPPEVKSIAFDVINAVVEATLAKGSPLEPAQAFSAAAVVTGFVELNPADVEVIAQAAVQVSQSELDRLKAEKLKAEQDAQAAKRAQDAFASAFGATSASVTSVGQPPAPSSAAQATPAVEATPPPAPVPIPVPDPTSTSSGSPSAGEPSRPADSMLYPEPAAPASQKPPQQAQPAQSVPVSAAPAGDSGQPHAVPGRPDISLEDLHHMMGRPMPEPAPYPGPPEDSSSKPAKAGWWQRIKEGWQQSALPTSERSILQPDSRPAAVPMPEPAAQAPGPSSSPAVASAPNELSRLKDEVYGTVMAYLRKQNKKNKRPSIEQVDAHLSKKCPGAKVALGDGEYNAAKHSAFVAFGEEIGAS